MSIYMWREAEYLCFTANTANSTVQLTKNGSPTAVTLETSTDKNTRTTYTIWDTITLSNIWDKVYWRNTSETDTGFSTSGSNYYQFSMSWNVMCSWELVYLLNKNWTNVLSEYCFRTLFYNCAALVTPPSLQAKTLAAYCYLNMFMNCTWLEALPYLPAETLTQSCYQNMFRWCTKIKLSTAQTWEYQISYRIPTYWSWTTATNALNDMFYSTWWTFTWTPTINTTYYTSNTVI